MRRYVPPEERITPPGYVTPSCSTALVYPDFEFGHPACNAPGYQHPVLGWTDVPCTCPCHDEGSTS